MLRVGVSSIDRSINEDELHGRILRHRSFTACRASANNSHDYGEAYNKKKIVLQS